MNAWQTRARSTLVEHRHELLPRHVQHTRVQRPTASVSDGKSPTAGADLHAPEDGSMGRSLKREEACGPDKKVSSHFVSSRDLTWLR